MALFIHCIMTICRDIYGQSQKVMSESPYILEGLPYRSTKDAPCQALHFPHMEVTHSTFHSALLVSACMAIE